MNKTLYAVGFAALAIPATASAQFTFEGAATLGYSMGEIESQDLNSTSLRVDTTAHFSENVAVDLRFGMRRMDVDGAPIDIDTSYFALDADYRFSNGVTVGGYYESSDIGLTIDNIGLPNLDQQSYGLTLGYDTGRWMVEGFYGWTDLEPLTDISGVDMPSYGLRGKFDVNDNFTIGANILRTELQTPGPDLDFKSFGLAGIYSFNEKVSIYGGFTRQKIEEGGVDLDATRTSLGVGYTFGTGNWAYPITASLELARTDISLSTPGPSGSTDFDEIRIGLTIPFGGKNVRAPLNSDAHKIIQGSRNVFTALVPH